MFEIRAEHDLLLWGGFALHTVSPTHLPCRIPIPLRWLLFLTFLPSFLGSSGYFVRSAPTRFGQGTPLTPGFLGR